MSDTTNKFGSPIQLAVEGGAIQPYIEEGVGSPNGVLTRPKGSLYLRTDVAQLWQNTGGGSAWTQIATGSSGAYFPSDVYVQFGDVPSYEIGFASSLPGFGVPAWLLHGVADYAEPAGSAGAPLVAILAQNAVTTTAGGPGVDGADMLIRSGQSDVSDPGATGGRSGNVSISTADAIATVGTSGPSGTLSLGTGSSADDVSGDTNVSTGSAPSTQSGRLNLTTGDGDSSGDVAVLPGDASGGATRAGNIVLYSRLATGSSLPSVVYLHAPLTLEAQARSPDNELTLPMLVKSQPIAGALAATTGWYVRRGGNGGSAVLIDIMFVKTGGAGGAGDTITISQTAGTWISIDLNGVAAGTVLRLGSAGVTETSANATVAEDAQIQISATQASNNQGRLYVYWTN